MTEARWVTCAALGLAAIPALRWLVFRMRDGLNRWALVGIVGGSGVLHFARPRFYRRIVPQRLGHANAVVAISGAAELLCAAAILLPATRRSGGWATAALLLAVFPANVEMALRGGLPDAPFPANNAAVAWLRVPLQVPLVLMALSVARGSRGPDTRTAPRFGRTVLC